MATPGKFEGKNQLIWDPSSLSTAQTCLYKYELSVLRGLVPESWEGGAKQSFGHAYHAGLEAYDLAVHQGETHDEAVYRAVAALEPYREVLSNPELLRTEDGKRRNFATLLRAVVWYTDVYKEDRCLTATLPNGEPAIEVRFEIPFGQRRLSGRVDRVVELDGALYLFDRKTTTQSLGDWYFRLYNPNNQVYSYIYALRHVLEIPVQGFIVDACQTLVGSAQFARQTFDVTDNQLEDWYESMAHTMRTAADCAQKDYFIKNFQGCSQYGGCAYRVICQRDPEFAEAFIEQNFKVKSDDRVTQTNPALYAASA